MTEFVGKNRVSPKHLSRYLEQKGAEHKEDVAREIKTYGSVRPAQYQVSNKTDKSYSRQRFASQEFRNGYEKVNWS